MLIPAIFHGSYKSSLQQSRAVVKRLVAGQSLTLAVGNDAINALELPDDIMLDHPYPGEGGVIGFYMNPLGELLGEGRSPAHLRRFPPQREQALFEAFLEQPWSLAILLGRGNAQSWLMDSPGRMRQYLTAIERHRAVFDALGPRFLTGTHSELLPWWNFPHGVGYSLANLGVPLDQARDFGHSGLMPDWRSVAERLEVVA
jgi:hypothetical protein